MTLIETLKKIFKDEPNRGFSYDDLARRTNYSKSTISRSIHYLNNNSFHDIKLVEFVDEDCVRKWAVDPSRGS